MATRGVYVRNGHPRRLPKGPRWPDHPLHPVGDQVHWFTQQDGVVSCDVCGPVGRQRRRDRRSPRNRQQHADPVVTALGIVAALLVLVIVISAVSASLGGPPR